MKHSLLGRKLVTVLLCAALLPQIASCGTIIYPERQNARHSGQIDIAVALMDGIGLLIFIIPGVVAFAVDFHTGAIYLPKGHPNIRKHKRSDNGSSPIKVIKVDPKKLNPEMISEIVAIETGFPISLDDPALLVKKAGEEVNIVAELEKMLDVDGEKNRGEKIEVLAKN